MIDALFSQTNYAATKRMLDVTELRHDAIASNMANLETPGYKRLDVSPTFTNDLKQAMAAKDPDRIANVPVSITEDLTARATGRDGNSVQLETELVKMSQNTVEHSLETQLITGSLLRLKLAISGRPS